MNTGSEALVIHGAGDLRLETVAAGEPGPDEVRVRPSWGGICGSDLHYLRHGGVGASVLRAPMVLGHEVSGVVDAVGRDVRSVAVGDAVAIHPARPCRQCPECRRGTSHLCRDMRFLGSAALLPHTDGGFRQALVVRHDQARPLPAGLDLRRAALAEPLAVALHAVGRAGPLEGRRAMVQGAGPIGALVVAALRRLGAARVVATDLAAHARGVAVSLGADEGWDAGAAMPDEEFDLVFEATGVVAALRGALLRTRRGGVLVQVGMFAPGDVSAPLSLVISREIDFRGTFRFDREFDDALAMLAADPGIADALVTRDFPLADYAAAFALSGDRSQASKVLLELA